ncbi:hypothetical protein MMPV_009670 [Pyropia vietnamensis]
MIGPGLAEAAAAGASVGIGGSGGGGEGGGGSGSSSDGGGRGRGNGGRGCDEPPTLGELPGVAARLAALPPTTLGVLGVLLGVRGPSSAVTLRRVCSFRGWAVEQGGGVGGVRSLGLSHSHQHASLVAKSRVVLVALAQALGVASTNTKAIIASRLLEFLHDPSSAARRRTGSAPTATGGVTRGGAARSAACCGATGTPGATGYSGTSCSKWDSALPSSMGFPLPPSIAGGGSSVAELPIG